jgi:hypothetical protein
MRKISIVLAIFAISFLNAQTKNIQGTYISVGKEKGIELKVNSDNSYEMVFLQGKVTTVNDTIVFENAMNSTSSFTVKQTENDDNVNKIDIRFKANNNNLFYDYRKIYLGTQNNDNEAINYTRIKGETEYNYGEINEDIVITIDKTKYLYLVEYTNDVAYISKYELNANVSGLEIEFSPSDFNKVELVGIVNEDNKIGIFQRSDNEHTRDFLLFEKKENIKDNKNEIKSIVVSKEKIFVAPDKDQINSHEEYETVEEISYFEFKLIVDSSLKEAQKTVSKTPKKYLAVAYDPSGKYGKKEFENFIVDFENNVKSYMYDAYDENYDLYNFYQATSKDKNLFDAKITEPQIIILNANGKKIYSLTGNLTDNAGLFSYYSELHQKIEIANAYSKVDEVISNKKATIPAVKTVLKESIKIEIPSLENDQYAEYTVVEDSDYNNEEVTVLPVDSTSVTNYSYYQQIDEENLYKLKSSKQTIDSKWKQVLEHYDKQINLDEDLVKIIKKEISNDGFSVRLFKERKEVLSDLDFKGIDYLLKYYDEIIAKEQLLLSDTVAIGYEYGYEYDRNLDDVLINLFNLNSYSNEEQSSEYLMKVYSYYKKYVTISDNNFSVYTNYLNALSSNLERLTDKTDFYNSYETYFNMTVIKDKNIYEALDEAYTKINLTTNDYNLSDWNSFKSSFSTLANTVAWSVVENEKDAELIKKAIQWSENSLKIEKDNAYYLDTLAQLYYKNGQKELAIATQKKALNNMKDEEDSSTYQEMKDVLNRMQNGTY